MNKMFKYYQATLADGSQYLRIAIIAADDRIEVAEMVNDNEAIREIHVFSECPSRRDSHLGKLVFKSVRGG